MALPQRHRLRDRALFPKIYRHGRRVRGPRLTLIALATAAVSAPRPKGTPADFAPLPPPPPSRVAIVISKKFDKRAVVRNRLRRQIQGILIERSAILAPGFAVIVAVNPNAGPCSHGQILQELDQLLKELRLLPNNGY
ncbi:MAG: ribonuclease P protein component [Cyanobacteria bacterium]|nr:ribonuclease P protein component [Cyanobacteriota bacterium]